MCHKTAKITVKTTFGFVIFVLTAGSYVENWKYFEKELTKLAPKDKPDLILGILVAPGFDI